VREAGVLPLEGILALSPQPHSHKPRIFLSSTPQSSRTQSVSKGSYLEWTGFALPLAVEPQREGVSLIGSLKSGSVLLTLSKM
jgi:hypothetical protein